MALLKLYRGAAAPAAEVGKIWFDVTENVIKVCTAAPEGAEATWESYGLGNTELAALVARVSTLEGDVKNINEVTVPALQKAITDALAEAKAYTDTETGRATAAEEALAGRLDIIEGEGDGSIKKALADAKVYTDEAIKALDVTDAAVTNEYVSQVTQTDGKIEVTRAALPVVDVQYNGTTIVEGAIAKLEKVVDTTVTADSANLITSGAVEAYVKAIGTVMEFKGVVEALPVLPSDLYNAGDVVIYDNEEYVLGTDGAWHEIGQVKTDEAVITLGVQADDADFAAVNQATGAVELDFAGAKKLIADGDAATLAAANKYTDDAIADLNADVTSAEKYTVTTTAEDGTESTEEVNHKVRVQVVEENGVITGVNVTETDIASAADLATLDAEVQEHEQVVSAALNDLNARMTTAEGSVADHETRLTQAEADIDALEGALADKNVAAESTTPDYVTATAADNKVTVAATQKTIDAVALAETSVQEVTSDNSCLTAVKNGNSVALSLVWEEGSF